MGDITELLQRWNRGDEQATEELFRMVYEDLRRRAEVFMRRENSEHTLQPTALVHEAYCRLVERQEWGFENRRHFYAVAAKTMRRILVDHYRQTQSLKRGGGVVKISLNNLDGEFGQQPGDLLRLDDALKAFEKFDPFKAKIVELRFFVGLRLEEISDVLGCSPSTITRHWRSAKSWLYKGMLEE